MIEYLLFIVYCTVRPILEDIELGEQSYYIVEICHYQ